MMQASTGAAASCNTRRIARSNSDLRQKRVITFAEYQAMEEALAKVTKESSDKDQVIATRDATIQTQTQVIATRDVTIQTQTQTIADRDVDAQIRGDFITTLEATVDTRTTQVTNLTTRVGVRTMERNTANRRLAISQAVSEFFFTHFNNGDVNYEFNTRTALWDRLNTLGHIRDGGRQPTVDVIEASSAFMRPMLENARLDNIRRLAHNASSRRSKLRRKAIDARTLFEARVTAYRHAMFAGTEAADRLSVHVRRSVNILKVDVQNVNV